MREQCAIYDVADLEHASRTPPLHREAEKEMERKFLVLLRRSHRYIVFYHTIESRHNIGYTSINNYVRFIKKTSGKHEEDKSAKAYVARRHMPRAWR